MEERADLELDKIETLDDALVVIKRLLLRVSELETENKQLKERIAVLEKNSSTSSKPPSSDITQAPKKRRQPGKRKRGAQKGHKAKFRELLSAEEVDRIKDLRLSKCPECSGLLRKDKVFEDVLVQQSAELKEKPIEVVEYRRHGCLCENCEAYYYPELPKGVIAGQLFGPKLCSLVAYFKGNLGASYTEIQQYCKDILQISVSRGLLCKVVERASMALKVPYEELQAEIPKQKSLNIDETGWKDNGNRYWVWIFCNSLIAYFTISPSRGCCVLKQVLGETFDGAITSDFYSAYVCYANARQQYCLAHLIRDIKFLTTLPDQQSKEFGEQLLKYFRRLFQHWHHRHEYPPGELEKKVKKLQRKLFTYLSNATLPKGKACTLNKRLMKHWKNLFQFVTDPVRFEPTNNNAEQVLRQVVRVRRQTQGSRSEMGRCWNARILTVIASCRKQKRSPWKLISEAVSAFHFNEKYPTLLPV